LAKNRHAELFVFRHGQTDWNAIDRFQGSMDIPLNETGRKQALQLAEKLRPCALEFILSSDLMRAYETAEIVGSLLSIQIEKSLGLREISFGSNEGRLGNEVWDELGPEFRNHWRACGSDYEWNMKMPQGERKRDALVRAQNAITKFMQETNYTRVGVSTHGGILRYLSHDSMAEVQDPISIPNCAVYRISWLNGNFVFNNEL
jgi:2,3-bisphosphoglycerate-dependent phosphoglycerate mutase